MTLGRACVLISVMSWCAVAAAAEPYFAIEVVDEATGRGVPLVRLETVNRIKYYTDSNGLIAFHEPGLMDQEVWFTVASHGYEFPQESFGQRGVALKVTPGGSAQLKIRRLNIAQRLYRITGQGVYRDTVLLGRKPPIEQPLLNGKVMGQDSTLTAVYQGKLYWFWGDTNRPGHFLGNFFMSGAVSDLPEKGGLDPSVGVNLKYFVDEQTGFSKQMAYIGREGPFPVWADAFLTIEDDQGRERLFAHYSRVKQDMTSFERGLMLYNDQTQRMEEFTRIPLDAKAAPGGHPLRANVDGQEYFYFPVPYPVVRVKADWDSVRDINAYEAFTCLKDGARYEKSNPALDRGDDGKLTWKWRKDTAPLSPRELNELIDAGRMKREESPFRLQNADDAKPVLLHGSSVYWNEYRKSWVMIGLELFGESLLGEVWFAEAQSPEGPWVHAKKVATHAMKDNNQDLYNPVQHPYFAQDGGRLIYFEGTYVNTFSGNPFPTPRYDYNQLMYQVDLSDERLKLPPMEKGLSSAKPSQHGH